MRNLFPRPAGERLPIDATYTELARTMSNHLTDETSPYLIQHADNPVDWYPWGEEALTLARVQNKPILLSVGYSACHWCHVMAHECFEDAEVAEVMNQYFINIKVDREERPDLDQIYQTALYMLTQRTGGWPLTLFLTPDQKPFFGGYTFRKSRARVCRAFSICCRELRKLINREGPKLSGKAFRC